MDSRREAGEHPGGGLIAKRRDDKAPRLHWGGIVGSGATRAAAPLIESYLSTLMP